MRIINDAMGKPLIGFDAFGAFPQTKFAAYQVHRQRFIDEAGPEGISVDQ